MGNSNTETGKANDMLSYGTATSGLGDLNNQLSQQAAGQGVVQQASQAQLQNATNQGVANAQGVVANTKGINAGMAARVGGYNAAQSLQQGANASAALTAQNAMGAQQLQAQNLNNQLNTAQGGINAINSANAGANSANQGALANGIGGAISGSSVASMLAEGGEVEEGVAPAPTFAPSASPEDPNKKSGGGGGGLLALLADGGEVNLGSKLGNAFSSMTGQKPAMMAKGGKAKDVKALVSPGERYLPPKSAKEVAAGKKDVSKSGEKIPGKAPVKGNSYANDIVPKTLKSGGVVIPRATMDKGKEAEAAFVRAVLSRKGKK